LESVVEELEALRWRQVTIESIPDQLEQILNAQDLNTQSTKEGAVIFDYDGTMNWYSDGILPINLVVDEIEWLLARFNDDGSSYTDYANNKIKEFESRNKVGIVGVPIQPVLDAVRLAQKKGLSVFVVTANQHEDKVRLILDNLKEWGLSNIEVYQTGDGQQKTSLIDEKIVGRGYRVRATVGDSSGGDEYKPNTEQAAPFIFVPTFMGLW
jgi:hypothetical protein